MSAIRCHFDGKVIVPDEPLNLPINQPLLVTIEPGVAMTQPANGGGGTVGELLQFAGIWKDRQDIGDSTEFVRALRRRAKHRERGED